MPAKRRLTEGNVARAAQEQALLAMHDRMIETFQANGEIIGSWNEEVLAVARAAAATGDYTAALKGYELLAKKLGLISTVESKHNHLHLTAANPDGSISSADLARASDADLREQLRRLSAPAPVTDAIFTPSPVHEAEVIGVGSLFE